MLDQQDILAIKEVVKDTVDEALHPLWVEITGIKGEITGIKGEIVGMKDDILRMDSKIDAVYRKLDAKIDSTHLKLEDKIQFVYQKLDKKIDNAVSDITASVNEFALDTNKRLLRLEAFHA